MLSYTIRYADEFAGYPRTLKIDTSGAVIWSSDIFEEISNGTAPIWQAQLKDSTVIQSYEVDRSSDPEFIINDWYRKPMRLIWLNKSAVQIREQLEINDDQHELYFSNLIAGKGNYFFAVGSFDFPDDEYYGLITKYSNDGDVIWSRRYRHPDFNSSERIHDIKDLVELDNGDLVVLGRARVLGQTSNIWFMKLNSEGCLGVGIDLCGEIVIGNSTATRDLTLSELSLYPNPTYNNVFSIRGLEDETVESINVYNSLGQLVYSERFPDILQIKIKDLTRGLYIVELALEGQSVQSLKLLKH